MFISPICFGQAGIQMVSTGIGWGIEASFQRHQKSEYLFKVSLLVSDLRIAGVIPTLPMCGCQGLG